MQDNKVTMLYTDGRGKEVRRSVNQTLDARDFLGTAIYPWMILAANPHLSAYDVQFWLGLQSQTTPGASRSRAWLTKRRWMVQQPGKIRAVGAKPDSDGKTAAALKIMADHPAASLRDLARLLRESSIHRSREWLRRNRCAAG